MKNNLIYLYQKIPEYDSEEFENGDFKYINNIKNYYLQLRNYFKSPNVFITKKTLQNFYSLNYDLLINKFLLYIENNIKNDINIINEEEEPFNNITKCIIYILSDLINTSFVENEDLCLLIYSKIENLINQNCNEQKARNIYEKIKNGLILIISPKIFEYFNRNNKLITPIMNKLSKLNKDLLKEICKDQEKNLIYDKNLDKKEEINDINKLKTNSMIENKINIYHFLVTSFYSLMEYEKIILVSEKYKNILDIHICLQNLTLEELIYFYSQKLDAIKNQISAYYKKKQLNSFISVDENNLEKINKEKIIIKLKIDILKYYASNIKNNNDEITENEILKIKNNDIEF